MSVEHIVMGIRSAPEECYLNQGSKKHSDKELRTSD